MIQKKKGCLITNGVIKNCIEGNPLISIITVVRNGEKHIEDTIKSILNQTYKNIEYIIIDGGSTDKTLEIISKYEDKIDYWISENDSGISEAFNKGINIAKGKLIGIVNSDDWLDVDAVEIIVHKMNEKYSIYCGNLRLYDTNLKLINTRRSFPLLLPLGMYIMHPTVFVKKDAYVNNSFDSSLKIAMDYDLLLRLRKKGYKIKNINRNISNMRIGGASCNIEKMRVEEKLVMKMNLPIYLYIIARIKLFTEKIFVMIFINN